MIKIEKVENNIDLITIKNDELEVNRWYADL